MTCIAHHSISQSSKFPVDVVLFLEGLVEDFKGLHWHHVSQGMLLKHFSVLMHVLFTRLTGSANFILQFVAYVYCFMFIYLAKKITDCEKGELMRTLSRNPTNVPCETHLKSVGKATWYHLTRDRQSRTWRRRRATQRLRRIQMQCKWLSSLTGNDMRGNSRLSFFLWSSCQSWNFFAPCGQRFTVYLALVHVSWDVKEHVVVMGKRALSGMTNPNQPHVWRSHLNKWSTCSKCVFHTFVNIPHYVLRWKKVRPEQKLYHVK